MKYITNAKVELFTSGNYCEKVYTPSYIAKDSFGGRMYDWSYLNLHKPAWYMRVAYKEWASHCVAYYPVPLNFLVRILHYFKWRILHACYWIGLIDVGEGECFTWYSFFRIKSQH